VVFDLKVIGHHDMTDVEAEDPLCLIEKRGEHSPVHKTGSPFVKPGRGVFKLHLSGLFVEAKIGMKAAGVFRTASEAHSMMPVLACLAWQVGGHKSIAIWRRKKSKSKYTSGFL